jgi:hypothetical protein
MTFEQRPEGRKGVSCEEFVWQKGLRISKDEA